jgi:hypothetical protein
VVTEPWSKQLFVETDEATVVIAFSDGTETWRLPVNYAEVVRRMPTPKVWHLCSEHGEILSSDRARRS